MLNHGKSSGIISNNKLIHLSLCYSYSYTIQGRKEPVQGGAILRATKSLWCASIRNQIQIWGAKFGSCPGRHLTSWRPWYHADLQYSGITNCSAGAERGGKGTQFPWYRITMWAPNHCGERQKSQHYQKCLLQCSTFASERPQVPTWWRQSCFLPQAPTNQACRWVMSFLWESHGKSPMGWDRQKLLWDGNGPNKCRMDNPRLVHGNVIPMGFPWETSYGMGQA